MVTSTSGAQTAATSHDASRWGRARRLSLAWAWLAFLAAPPTVESQGTSSARPSVALHDVILSEALPVMGSSNYQGLGTEVRLLSAWMRDRPAPWSLDATTSMVRDKKGRGHAVSAVLAVTLTRLNQWYGLSATEDNPITHEQLRAAVLAAPSVLRIRGLFEDSIRRSVRVDGQWLSPESGGEATLGSELNLVESPDPRWQTVQDLVKLTDPSDVARFYESRVLDVAEIDAHGLLRVGVARLRKGHITAAAEVQRAVITVARNTASTYSLSPEDQFALIASRNWSGRYVGRFHTHAPHQSNGEWIGSDAPSFEDMQNAVQAGQYLTVSFQPDGFDLYDAAPLADPGRIDLRLLKVIRYRSASWRSHFDALTPTTK